MQRIGIIITGEGIGDKVQFGSFPENMFRNTGQKPVDTDRCWVFDHNPYVTRGGIPDITIDLWLAGVDVGYKYEKLVSLPSVALRTCEFLGLKCFLRHPRLYIFEDLPINPNRIAIHVTGKTVGSMPDHVLS